MKSIICAGFGGQGALTSGLILAYAGLDAGKYSTWIPSYGSEMRGGTANCQVKIDDKQVASPYIRQLDVLIAMNEPSITKFMTMVKPGGIIIANSSLVKTRELREDIKVFMLPASETMEEMGNARGVNIYMLGAFVGAEPMFEKEFFMAEIDKFFAEKGKNNPQNKIAFEAGYAAAVKG